MAMTLDEAIKVLERYFVHNHPVLLAELKEAGQLGIKTLKAVKRGRAETEERGYTL